MADSSFSAKTNPLLDNQIQLWYARLDQPPETIAALATLLSKEEAARAKRFYFERDRLHFIAARGILRTLLGYYLEYEPGRLEFSYNPHGKPALGGRFEAGDLQFNLSHSHELVVYAFTRRRQLGIDLEYLRPVEGDSQIVRDFFSLKEQSTFLGLPAQLRTQAFFQGWTCKEAFLKASGSGLSRELNEIEVDLDPALPARLLDPLLSSSWQLETSTPMPGYLTALVVEAESPLQIASWQSWPSSVFGRMNTPTNP